MAEYFKITAEQEDFLNSFTCERMGTDQKAREEIEQFKSEDGEALVENLLMNGWYANQRGSIAYYVIRNAAKEIVLFFSLKCGVLFDPNPVVDFMKEFKNIRMYQTWLASRSGDWQARRYMDMMRTLMGDELYKQKVDELKAYHHIKIDKRDPLNSKMIRVFDGLSAIELVEFCSNDATKGCWDKAKMGQNTMGKTLFWKFIYPKMVQISSLIGSDYAFLFAADGSEDHTLITYYESLHFQIMPKMGTVKPFYDMNCYFMAKRLRTMDEDQLSHYDLEADSDPNGLDYYCNEFFDYFNQPKDT